MIIESSFKQGSISWHKARLQSVGSTGLSKIITNAKCERSESRAAYILEKAGDIISQDSKPIFQTWEMKWGHKYEPEARNLFSLANSIEISQCAMIFSDDLKRWHISPDGFNEDIEIGLEIKCPQIKEFKRTKKANKMPTKHILQVQSSLALTGFKSWYFMSFFPGLHPFMTRVDRDEEKIKIIKAEVRIFLRDLDKEIEELRK